MTNDAAASPRFPPKKAPPQALLKKTKSPYDIAWPTSRTDLAPVQKLGSWCSWSKNGCLPMTFNKKAVGFAVSVWGTSKRPQMQHRCLKFKACWLTQDITRVVVFKTYLMIGVHHFGVDWITHFWCCDMYMFHGYFNLKSLYIIIMYYIKYISMLILRKSAWTKKFHHVISLVRMLQNGNDLIGGERCRRHEVLHEGFAWQLKHGSIIPSMRANLLQPKSCVRQPNLSGQSICWIFSHARQPAAE